MANIINYTKKLVIMCVGSNKVLFDCFGCCVGTLLKKSDIKAYIYGSVDKPITSSNIDTCFKTIKRIHPSSKILVVDATTSQDENNLGSINFYNTPCKCIKKDIWVGDMCLLCSTFCVKNGKVESMDIVSILSKAKYVSNCLKQALKS